MKLTEAERWILSNQFRILAELQPQFADDHKQAAEAIESGYEIAYRWFSQHIDRETVSEEIGREVLDVLGMFDAMNISVSKVPENKELRDKIRFPGFDEHSEMSHLAFGGFLNREGKFGDIKVVNSHFPNLDKYRRMLKVWKGVDEHYELSLAEIESILNA